MNNGGDAAEQIVRMSLNGIEVAAKISGEGAKNIALLLFALLKDGQQTKGKARLTSMLRSGKELKVFTMKNEDIAKFQKEAKRYGVLYCVLKDKDNKDPHAMVDIIARAEDASKISRIVERFNLASTNTATIVQEAEKSKAEKSQEKEVAPNVPKHTQPEKSEADKIIDAALEKPLQKQENQKTDIEEKEKATPENPMVAKTEKSPLSEPSLDVQEPSAHGVAQTMGTKKPSVRAELDQLRIQMKAEKEVYKRPVAKEEKANNPLRQTKHTQPIHKKKVYRKPKER